MNKARPTRRDTYIFTNSDAGRTLRTQIFESLANQGITTEDGEETIAGTAVLQLIITGKRPGEGRTAKDTKEGI